MTIRALLAPGEIDELGHIAIGGYCGTSSWRIARPGRTLPGLILCSERQFVVIARMVVGRRPFLE
jgi:hypothetical protein